MDPTHGRLVRATLAVLALAVALLGAFGLRAAGTARLEDGIRHWSAVAADTSASDELSRSVKDSSRPMLRQIEAEVVAGRRWAALHRLAGVCVNLAGAEYVASLPADRRDEAGFEAEWTRIGRLLAQDSVRASVIAGIEPAAARAEAEAALPQARIFREASLEYGRNTEPQYGLFYLGSALAARDFALFCRSLGEPAKRRAPPLRSIRAELDDLQGRLLTAYRPPASVARHAEFIGASSALKEARALDAMGFHHGAMLRYLSAAIRSRALIDTAAAPSALELTHRLDEFAVRIDADGVDHSIAQVFVELARSEMAAAPGTSPAIAVAVVTEALPRYFAALEPHTAPVAARPEVDVTLVRWPFT